MKAAPAARYPASAFPQPANLQRVNVCAISNELATAACERADAAYAIDLPGSRVPRDACSVHRGEAITQEKPKRSVPQSIFRSFKKFFGGE